MFEELTRRIDVRVSESMQKRLRDQARRHHTTAAEIIRRGAEEKLAQLETKEPAI